MTANNGGQLGLVRRYRQLVEAYEALDGEIDELLTAARGKTERMSAADLRQYRGLARKRTELLNDMRQLEQALNLTGDDKPSTN
ncbi:MAG: hypothetical protein OXN88_03740 [Chloroflexota bacterium]|nr:hypothetical protein [Chloroflexota bacterium]